MMGEKHTHIHSHDVVNPSGQPVHQITHCHEHIAEMNGHHHYTEEPPKLLWIDEVGNVPSDEELERAVKTISSQKGITIYKSHPKDICEEVR